VNKAIREVSRYRSAPVWMFGDFSKETTHNWEFGANYSRTGGLSDKDELGVKLACFDNETKGYIARRYISKYFAMQMYNIDQARFQRINPIPWRYRCRSNSLSIADTQ
jgi:outer membrane receptor protein involved in Fe transport